MASEESTAPLVGKACVFFARQRFSFSDAGKIGSSILIGEQNVTLHSKRKSTALLYSAAVQECRCRQRDGKLSGNRARRRHNFVLYDDSARSAGLSGSRAMRALTAATALKKLGLRVLRHCRFATAFRRRSAPFCCSRPAKQRGSRVTRAGCPPSFFRGRATYRVGVGAGHRAGRAGAAGVGGTSCAEAALPCIAGQGTARVPPTQLVYLYAALSISAGPHQSMAPSRAGPRLRCLRAPSRPRLVVAFAA